MKPSELRRFAPARSTLALVAGVTLAIASLAVQPSTESKTEIITTDEAQGDVEQVVGTEGPLAAAGGQAEAAGKAGTSNGTAAGGRRQGEARVAEKPGLACAPGRNGGPTDVGVSGDAIKLGATVVESGIGASFLGDVRYAMQAVADKANRAGGVCGRQLRLKLVDDGWNYQRGGEYIRNLVEGDKVFALAVVPSSEGLKNASDSGYIRSSGVPVVGSDGMLFGQYTDPWIWPVAASTVSTMHIMAKQAHDAGATEFAIVYESTYHFGVEGAYAFNAAVKRLTGRDIEGYSDPLTNPKCEKRFCGINAGQASYNSEIQTLNQACGQSGVAGSCQFVAMLLEPATALTWMKGGGIRADQQRRLGGPQPLFTYDFANSCGQQCDQLWLWTGYYPPLGDYLGRPAIATYVNDIKAASSSADYNNSFVEGGYLGMSLLVKALHAVGPNLTRANLKAVLDSMTFDSGLTAPLTWKAGNHFANTRMQAFSIQYKSGFAGWRDERVVIEDPWVGQDGGR